MFPPRIRVVLTLLLVAFVAHAPALLGVLPGALPSTGDTLGAFAPWHAFVRGELASNGAIPLWNPHFLGGVPFAANGQSALFYPPNYLHFVLPEGLALWLFAFLHTHFFMLGGYFLGRTLGMSRRAALLVALLLGLGNATPAHLFGGHLTFLPARSFWPWQAAFLIRILQGKATEADPRNAVALAACLGLGLAAGAPQIWLFGVLFCLAITVFWLVRAAQNRIHPARWPWQSGGLALVLTVLWCAPLLLPLRELRSWSSHGATLSFAEVTDLSATPRSLFRLLFNGFFGGNSYAMWSLPSNPGEDGASLGLAALLLALSAPFVARSSRVARALWPGCGVVLILALGSATPLYRALYDHLVLFQITRVPARWLELWAFGAALLAGFCFEATLQDSRRTRRFSSLWIGGALACFALGAWAFWSSSPWQSGAKIVARALNLSAAQAAPLAASLQNDALLACVLGFFAMSGLGMLGRRRSNSTWSSSLKTGLILAALCAEPLANFWLSVRIAPAAAVQNAQLPPALARRFRAGQRWIVRAPFQQLNAPLSRRIDALNGYEPFGSAPFFRFAGAAQPGARFAADFQPREMTPLWRVMGASHLLWKPKAAGDAPREFPGKIVARAGEWRLNSLQDGLKPWPRSYLTRQISPGGGAAGLQILRKMAAQPFNFSPPATVDGDFSSLLNLPMAGGETSRETVSSPDLLVHQIAPAHPSLWVHNAVMAPGWRAYVDGKPAKIHLANGIFRGVFVPAGARQIALVYNPQTLRFSLFLAACGMSWAAFCWTVRPRRDAP